MSFLRHIITPSVLALIFCTPWAQAQSWPTRPVRIIVPFAPGSTMESVVRTLAPELTRALGQPILVENKPGAGTVVGVDAAAKAAPDGYTFVSVANSFTVNATLVPKLPYDTLKDLQPVILTARTANVLVAHPSVSANTLREFVALAKQQPGRLTYASFGNGTTAHFAGEILKTMATIDIVHVPYKGQGPALGDVLAGQVNAMFCNLPDCLPHVRAGKLKAYGTTYAERAALAPDLPTIAEQGYPGFYTDSWYGLMAPTGVSRDIIQRMNNVILRSIGEGEIREAFIKRGLDPLGGTSERFGEHLRSEIAKYAKVVKDAQMKID
jgi:tripartite-type tricarboxylate transporter receptor subunit TctC